MKYMECQVIVWNTFRERWVHCSKEGRHDRAASIKVCDAHNVMSGLKLNKYGTVYEPFLLEYDGDGGALPIEESSISKSDIKEPVVVWRPGPLPCGHRGEMELSLTASDGDRVAVCFICLEQMLKWWNDKVLLYSDGER